VVAAERSSSSLGSLVLLFSLEGSVLFSVRAMLFSVRVMLFSVRARLFSTAAAMVFSVRARLFGVVSFIAIAHAKMALMRVHWYSAMVSMFVAQTSQSMLSSGMSPNATIGWMVMQMIAVIVMTPTMAKLGSTVVGGVIVVAGDV